MLYYKFDVVAELKKKGYTSYRMRNEGIMSLSTYANLKEKKNVGMDTINTLCCIFRCQPSDIIECRISDEEKIKFF